MFAIGFVLFLGLSFVGLTLYGIGHVVLLFLAWVTKKDTPLGDEELLGGNPLNRIPSHFTQETIDGGERTTAKESTGGT